MRYHHPLISHASTIPKKSGPHLTLLVWHVVPQGSLPGRSQLASARAGFADLPLIVAVLQVKAASRAGLRRVGHERGDVGLGVASVHHDLVDVGDDGILPGRRDATVGVAPLTLV